MHTEYRKIRQQLFAGETTLPELVDHYLERIEANRDLNIYVEVYAAAARQRATELQTQLKNGDAMGRLFGMVLSIKDNICHANHGVTGGSKILKGYVSPFSATAVERLLAEGAIIIGRTNCDEFGMGSSTEKSTYGSTKNPLDPTRVAGGSSGGAAASVAAGTCLAALGTDTGGSVRQPASFCGLVGLKPSYGRISRWGLLAYGSSFDQVGTLTRNVDDAALLLQIMAGADELDATASQRPVANYTGFSIPERRMRIAVLENTFDGASIEPEIRAVNQDFFDELDTLGHEVKTVPFDLMEYLVPAYYVLTTAEASSNLSRYDGVRYGHRSAEARDINSLYKKSRTEGFGEEVKRRILLGTFVLSEGYYDAYYGRAQRVRRQLSERLEALLEDFDFIMMPTSPVLPWHGGAYDQTDPTAMYLADIFTVPASLAGLPCVSFPIGTDAASGLSVGMQLMGRNFGEEELLTFVRRIEAEI